MDPGPSAVPSEEMLFDRAPRRTAKSPRLPMEMVFTAEMRPCPSSTPFPFMPKMVQFSTVALDVFQRVAMPAVPPL